MIPYCNFKGIGLIPWGPLNGGLLTRPVDNAKDTTRGAGNGASLSDADKIIINRVEELAKKHGKTMTQVALAWVATKVTSPIVGTSSVKRLEENIDYELQLSDDEVKYLEEP